MKLLANYIKNVDSLSNVTENESSVVAQPKAYWGMSPIYAKLSDVIKGF